MHFKSPFELFPVILNLLPNLFEQIAAKNGCKELYARPERKAFECRHNCAHCIFPYILKEYQEEASGLQLDIAIIHTARLIDNKLHTPIK